MDDLERSLGRIEGGISQIVDRLDNLDDMLRCHDKRIRNIENQQIYWKGGLGVLSVLITFCMYLFLNLVKG